jgi:hypothetical protein
MSRYTILVLLALGARGFAQVVSYDGTAFPEETGDGWIHLEEVYPADRWIDDGWLVQYAEIVDPGPPAEGERDSYRRELDDQAAVPAWYLEWVVVTDGPEAFSATAPACIAAGGQSGVLYHFTIAEDEVRFVRDPYVPLVFADLTPGEPHVFRLELRNAGDTGTYVFTINGEVIDAGVGEGHYPTDDSSLVFGARAAIEASETRWDYIEFGRLDNPIPTVSAWGVVVMSLLVLTAGTLVFGRHRLTSLTSAVT